MKSLDPEVAARARPAIERSLAILRAQDGDVRAALGDALHLSGYLRLE
jgi:hypothetical protein